MKVALVTGAAQGIGGRTAEVLAQRGFSLALNDLRSPTETTAQVRSLGVDVIEVLGDVSDETAVARMADSVMTKYRRIDVSDGEGASSPSFRLTPNRRRPRARDRSRSRFVRGRQGMRSPGRCHRE